MLAGRFPRRLLAIGGLALAVRVVFTLAAGFAADGINDSKNYHLLGRWLARGEGYIRAFDRLQGVTEPTAEFPPAFPALLGLLHLVGIDTVGGQELFLTLVGTATVVLVGLVGREVGGDRVGLVAAGLAAVYPMLLLPDATLQAEGLFGALVAATLLAAYRARREPTPRRLVTTGLLVGAAALTRSEGLLLLLVVLLPAVRSWRAVAVAAVPALALVGLWTVRNAARLDHLVPLSNNSGTLLAGANCDDSWSGKHRGLWLFSCTLGVEADGLDETERTRRYSSAGLDYVGDHLGRAPYIAAVRVLRVFGVWHPSDQLDWEALEGRNRNALTAGHVMFAALAVAAAAGLVLTRGQNLPIGPLLGTIALVAFTAAATYGNQRFRITAEPALVVLAASGLVAASERLRSRPIPAAAHP